MLHRSNAASDSSNQASSKGIDECERLFVRCDSDSSSSNRAGSRGWAVFRDGYATASALEAQGRDVEALSVWLELADGYGMDAATALACPMALAAVLYRLATFFRKRGYYQRAHNLHQLAMSQVWQTSRTDKGLECLDGGHLWGIQWSDFMKDYLTLAAQLGRNQVEGLPQPQADTPIDYKSSLRIGVVTLCEYPEGSPLPRTSRANREGYTSLHGYANHFYTSRPPHASPHGSATTPAAQRHPVWGAIALTLHHLETESYDWLLWMDCDSMFANMTHTIDFLIHHTVGTATPPPATPAAARQCRAKHQCQDLAPRANNNNNTSDGWPWLDPSVHLLISEDGRGLAGGNWLVRNSPWSKQFLREVYGPDGPSNPFLRHDLRDQFSLLWHLIRPLATTPIPPLPLPLRQDSSTGSAGLQMYDLSKINGGNPWRPASWDELEYPTQVRLVPQRWINAYPWAICRHTPSHHCFNDRDDFVVAFPTLTSFSDDMVEAFLEKFLNQSLASRETVLAARKGDQL
ncbi:unnamed protein product [Vitrella brassicaformis CCMP3155]|uniref:Uncharacterized protein n=1 Tax=Vitrella brassicaformis (strain CCMP3155) TaxID=1169540 RepID=A0A0G4GZB9_VITBC|nr:unnamed protein product [Vitrella brassicaformis CCMP3155]|eukprot:CEM36601.1 unnamed protein product [Vitrella brassicaformis CCMP3155]